MKSLYTLVACLLLSTVTFAQSVEGKWTTIDDETGKAKSTVEIYKVKDQLYGKVVHLYPRPGIEPDPVCEKCSDDRKGKKVVGLQIIRDLKFNGKEWQGGTVLDPENGKVYKCKITFDPKNPDVLILRGYVGPFSRSQTWKRAK